MWLYSKNITKLKKGLDPLMWVLNRTTTFQCHHITAYVFNNDSNSNDVARLSLHI